MDFLLNPKINLLLYTSEYLILLVLTILFDLLLLLLWLLFTIIIIVITTTTIVSGHFIWISRRSFFHNLLDWNPEEQDSSCLDPQNNTGTQTCACLVVCLFAFLIKCPLVQSVNCLDPMTSRRDSSRPLKKHEWLDEGCNCPFYHVVG